MKLAAYFNLRAAAKSVVPSRSRIARILIGLETALTLLPFLISWLICAIGLAFVAGFQMAKADDAVKPSILARILGGKS